MQIIPFTPSSVGNQIPLQFEPVLDGDNHMATIYWNTAGQRFYMLLINLKGGVVFNQSLNGSPIGQTIESLVWQDGFVLGTTDVPTSFRIGDTLPLTINDCVPGGYNGIQRCLITGPDTFSYPLATDPGELTGFGTLSFDIDLLAGYGYGSTLIFRGESRLFELRP
jgi:hypothetical protein